MNVEVRLHGTLAARRPALRAGESFRLDLPDKASIATLVLALRIAPEEIHLVFVNGRAAYDRTQSLAAGDRVGLFPPVGGG